MNAIYLLIVFGAIVSSLADEDLDTTIASLSGDISLLSATNTFLADGIHSLHSELDKKMVAKMARRKGIERLKVINKYLERVERIVQAEHEADEYLRQIPTSFRGQLEDDMKEVMNEIAEMKTYMSETLRTPKSALQSVDMSAKSRNVIVAGVLYYGEVGSACSTGNDICKLSDTECRADRCQCKPGLSFDSLHKKCTDECPTYGNHFQTVPNYIIRKHNNLVLNETTLLGCKERCVDEKAFTCKTFDWFPRWSTCYLSEQTRYDVSADAWEYSSVAIHFQRDCFVN